MDTAEPEQVRTALRFFLDLATCLEHQGIDSGSKAPVPDEEADAALGALVELARLHTERFAKRIKRLEALDLLPFLRQIYKAHLEDDLAKKVISLEGFEFNVGSPIGYRAALAWSMERVTGEPTAADVVERLVKTPEQIHNLQNQESKKGEAAKHGPADAALQAAGTTVGISTPEGTRFLLKKTHPGHRDVFKYAYGAERSCENLARTGAGLLGSSGDPATEDLEGLTKWVRRSFSSHVFRGISDETPELFP